MPLPGFKQVSPMCGGRSVAVPPVPPLATIPAAPEPEPPSAGAPAVRAGGFEAPLMLEPAVPLLLGGREVCPLALDPAELAGMLPIAPATPIGGVTIAVGPPFASSALSEQPRSNHAIAN